MDVMNSLGLTVVGKNGSSIGGIDRLMGCAVAVVPANPFGVTVAEIKIRSLGSPELIPISLGPVSSIRRARSVTLIGFATAELAQPRSAPAESTRRRDAIRSRSVGIIPNSTDISDLAGFLLRLKSPDSPASGLECDVMIVFMVRAASAANMAGTACVIFMGNFPFEASTLFPQWPSRSEEHPQG